MGASFSLAEDPDFISAQQDLRTLKTTLSDYPTLKTKVGDLSSAVAGSLNYDNLAAKITDVDAYNRKIADKISDSPGKLGDSLNQKMADNANFIAKIGKLLEDNTKFTDSLAATLTDTSKTYRTKITGPKGDSGELSSSAASVKDNLYTKKYTVWCADGDVCQLPVGSKGFSSGEDITLTPKTAVNVAGNANVAGNMKIGNMTIDGATIKNPGRIHVAGDHDFYVLNKNGMTIGKDWGGNGNLAVQGALNVGGRLDVKGDTQFDGIWVNKDLSLAGDAKVGGWLKIGQWYLQDIGSDLRIHKGNAEDRWWTFGGDGQVYARGRGGRALNG